MPDNLRIGVLLTNADMDETMDRSEMIQHFFTSHPGIRDWCQNNLTSVDEHTLNIYPKTWGRYHTEWIVELRNLSQSESVAARLRFS